MDALLKCSVLVVGGGSAGVGAAWRAALCGADTVLIEPENLLGGTSTLGGVNEWEPGVASFGLNRRLYARLDEKSIGIGRGPAPCAERHIGLNRIDRALKYEDTLRRAGVGGGSLGARSVRADCDGCRHGGRAAQRRREDPL